jgi:hypothetical protein
MISAEYIEQLTKNNIHYIIGARLGNGSYKVIDEIDKKSLKRKWEKYRNKP